MLTRTLAVLLAALCLAAPARAAPVTWTEPRPIAPDTTPGVYQGCHTTVARDTVLWTLWFEERDSLTTLLKASRYSGDSWLEPESIACYQENPYLVQAAVDADLNPWAVWGVTVSYPDSQYSVWCRRQDDSWTTPALITSDPNRWGYCANITADPEQGIWAIWCHGDLDSASMSVYSSRWAADSWTPPTLIARFTWYVLQYWPVLTVVPHGKVWSVWTGDVPTGIGQCSATWNGDTWTGQALIPSAWMGIHPSICSDSAGGVWVTWLRGMDEVRYAHHDGLVWADTGYLATGYVAGGELCCDDRGRVWALWTYTSGTPDSTAVYARYFDGDTWSATSVVTRAPGVGNICWVSATLGRVWVTWSKRERDGRELLYYSYTLGPGIAETPPVAVAPRPLPTILRNSLVLPRDMTDFGPGKSDRVPRHALMDACGRKVMNISPGPNGISHLSPGVYFIHSPVAGRYSQPAVKVVIQR